MQMLEELATLDDAALHGALKQSTGKANTLTAQLLAQLAELEARGIYRERACASLYTYCVYELRMSEDEAQRRCRAARLARQFPVLLQMLAESSIHLTGILLLGPHLTAENHSELLERARYRTKREIERLVATVAPGADVPASVRPLRRAGAEEWMQPDAGLHPARPRNTWAAFVQALAGPVRHLTPGTGPGQAPPPSSDVAEGPGPLAAASTDSTPAPLPAQAPPPLVPAGMRYHVQFSADQAYIDLLEEARDLLQTEVPDRNLVEAQRRALQLLVEQLRRRKCAATERPRAPQQTTSAQTNPAVQTKPATQTKPTRQTRHLPAALRRAVWHRDGARCTYADERGVRCRETAGLEFHHLQPYARGGPNTAENVALRCRAHNTLAAEADFGAEHMRHWRRGADDERRAGAVGAGSREERPPVVREQGCPAPG